MGAAEGWRRRALNAASGMGVTLVRGETPAYELSSDVVETPRLYPSASSVMAFLHELAHATGHPSRLKRGTRWEDYAREEVVAELTANRVAKRLGIPSRMRHSSRGYATRTSREYVKTWLGHYGRNPRDPRRGGDRPRTRAEATSIMKDVREAENYLMSHIDSGGRFRRARAVRGGGA